jgi:dTDP-4-dehydrorhamnose reductase
MIVIFGGGGQVALELAATCSKRGLPYCSYSRTAIDIADPEAVAYALRCAGHAIAVNAAGYTNVDLAETEMSAAMRANARGPAVLASACAAAGVPLIHLSTDYVFDGKTTAPYVEGDPTAPLGVYGQTKLAGEEAVRAGLPEHVILRTSWVFGSFRKNLLKTVLALAPERDELRFVADQHGCPTATADIAEAILSIEPRLAARERVWGTYHFAGTAATTWFEFVRQVVESQAAYTGCRPRVLPITTDEYPTPARRPAHSVLNSGLFARTFGLSARPWQERVDESVRRLIAAPARAA